MPIRLGRKKRLNILSLFGYGVSVNYDSHSVLTDSCHDLTEVEDNVDFFIQDDVGSIHVHLVKLRSHSFLRHVIIIVFTKNSVPNGRV